MIWLTEIRAIDPMDNEIKIFSGPRIEAESLMEAEDYCLKNGLGYCKVIGRLVEESDHKEQFIWLN